MNVLITGATGFIGKNLLQQLKKRTDLKIVALVRNLIKAPKLELPSNIRYIKTSEPLDLGKNLNGFNPEVIVNLAGFSSSNDDFNSAIELINSNIILGTSILAQVDKSKLKTFINTGSFAEFSFKNEKVIRKNAYLYSATKQCFNSILEYYARIYSFQTITVYPFTVYGPNEPNKKVIHYILDSLNSKKPIAMTEGNQLLDFIHISDVISFYTMIINNINTFDKKNHHFHLGTGKQYSLKEVANILEEVSQKVANIEWGARPYRAGDIMSAKAEIPKIMLDLGWLPKVNLKLGLKSIL